MIRRPLHGVIVVDLTMAWAGPMATRYLAELGATVIKIEGPQHMDRWRGGTFAQRGTARYPDSTPGDRPWNRNSFFNTQNRGKLGIGLDLKTPEGKDVLTRLLAKAQLLVENFSAGAMGRLGFDYDSVHRINPRLVMVSMPAMGRTGPDSSFIAHGPTIEELSGTTYLQGYFGGGPHASGGFAWGDPIAGIYGGLACVAGLYSSRRNGHGAHLDLSQLEAGVTFNADSLAHAQTGDLLVPRLGNRNRNFAPQGVYRCRGDDRWIAISVDSDAAWARLRELLGEWADKPSWSSVAGRREAHTELDEAIAKWTSTRDRDTLARDLQARGIAAAPVSDARDLAGDPQLHELGFFVEVAHPEAGTHEYPGQPFRSAAFGPPISAPAPMFGQHNDLVMTSVLGMDRSEIESLYESGAMHTEPYPQGD